MADDDVLDGDATPVVAEDVEEEEGFEDDLDGAGDLEDDDVVVAVGVIGDDVEADVAAVEEVDEDADDLTTPAGKAEAKAKAKAKADEDEDDDEADPDDVEEDLDTILRDRIAAGTDDDDDDEDEIVVDQPEGGDRVAPRAAEEYSCPECFLLVRASQFSTRRTDCPGGLDGEDCPMKQRFV